MHRNVTDFIGLSSLPTLSVVIVTLNCARQLEKCLSSVVGQEYPKELVEILVIDGGSTDGTIESAKRFDAKVVSSHRLREDQEARRAVGIAHAKNEIVVSIDSDNILPHGSWLRNMVAPFIMDPDIVGAQPGWFTYRPNDPLLVRYFSLAGGTDPVGLYLGTQDHFMWGSNRFPASQTLEDRGTYFMTNLRPELVLSFGCNGFLARRTLLQLAEHDPPERFSHIDAVYDLVVLGHTKFAIVKESIVHVTAADNDLLRFVKKRILYMQRYHLRSTFRRFKLYSKGDDLRLFICALSCLSVVRPFCDSLRGYLRTGDPAWFIHVFHSPLLASCYAFAVSLNAFRAKGTQR
jgi:glycosyltransferase involved in cell wall biosynthesis